MAFRKNDVVPFNYAERYLKFMWILKNYRICLKQKKIDYLIIIGQSFSTNLFIFFQNYYHTKLMFLASSIWIIFFSFYFFFRVNRCALTDFDCSILELSLFHNYLHKTA